MSSTLHALSASSAASGTLIAARWYDYIPIAIYFAFVIGVGLIARAKAATADGFLTSGRSLPAWVTGIAFVSANLGAVGGHSHDLDGAASEATSGTASCARPPRVQPGPEGTGQPCW